MNPVVIWTVVVSIAGGIVTMYAAYPAISEWRFWASRWEVQVLADRVYPRTLADQQRITLSLEDRLEWLRARAKAGKMEPGQWGEIPVIEDAIKKSKRDEARIIHEESLIRGSQELR